MFTQACRWRTFLPVLQWYYVASCLLSKSKSLPRRSTPCSMPSNSTRSRLDPCLAILDSCPIPLHPCPPSLAVVSPRSRYCILVDNAFLYPHPSLVVYSQHSWLLVTSQPPMCSPSLAVYSWHSWLVITSQPDAFSIPDRLHSALSRYLVNSTAPLHSRLNSDPLRMSSVPSSYPFLPSTMHSCDCILVLVVSAAYCSSTVNAFSYPPFV